MTDLTETKEHLGNETLGRFLFLFSVQDAFFLGATLFFSHYFRMLIFLTARLQSEAERRATLSAVSLAGGELTAHRVPLPALGTRALASPRLSPGPRLQLRERYAVSDNRS